MFTVFFITFWNYVVSVWYYYFPFSVKAETQVTHYLIQVVIEKKNLRDEKDEQKAADELEMYYLQIAQLIVVLVLILAV